MLSGTFQTRGARQEGGRGQASITWGHLCSPLPLHLTLLRGQALRPADVCASGPFILRARLCFLICAALLSLPFPEGRGGGLQGGMGICYASTSLHSRPEKVVFIGPSRIEGNTESGVEINSTSRDNSEDPCAYYDLPIDE